MELLFKIIWIILAITTLSIVYLIARKFARIMNAKILYERDIEMYKLKFSELEIISHLDFIIDECIDYYVTMNITPKQLYYINNNMETDMVNTLGEIVQERISPTLYSQLSLLYSADQIGIVVGEKIYTKVLEYVISFNVSYEHKNKK